VRQLDASAGAKHFPLQAQWAAAGVEASMGILKAIGAILIITWLVLWLFVKITFAAVHLLFLIGVAMLIFGFIRRETA
jgi:Flp pilus assembly protein TadB